MDAEKKVQLLIPEGVLTCYNCNFTNNSAVGEGGVIISWSSLTVYSCIFNNNKSKMDGGAIFFWSDSLNIDKCTFTNNKAGTNKYGDSG